MNIIVNKITTAIACLNTGRQYIGFELDETYYKKSLERIEKHKGEREIREMEEAVGNESY